MPVSEQSNLSSRLREGIDAAKRGDKLTARRLLQQVLSIDGDNELALMWMASVVDSLNERRFFLERALSINPNNARAREALRRLGVEDPQPRRAAAPAASDYVRNVPGRGGNNLYLIAAAIVAFVVVAVVVAALVSSLQQQPTPIAPQNAQATFSAFINPTATPSPERRAPTATVLPGIVVTLDPNLITPLPPTFTPTFTAVPSETPQPTMTPIPLGEYTIIYSDIEPGAATSSLYRGNADGTGEIKLEAGDAGGFSGMSYDPSGERIVFVRVIANAESTGLPQLFVAPSNAPQDAVQLTTLDAGVTANPSWSPDGTQIIFSSGTGQPEDEEIWIINADGSNAHQLTDNGARDFDPQFSPDGSKIVYASELDSPDFSEIYVMDADGGNVTQLTEVPNSYSPAWSPDAARIAYVNDSQGDGDIYVMDANGERSFLLTQDDSGAEDRDPTWSPDGRWIVFATNRDDEEFRWYAIDLQGDVQSITVTGRNPESLSFVTD
jgi:TolB protein